MKLRIRRSRRRMTTLIGSLLLVVAGVASQTNGFGSFTPFNDVDQNIATSGQSFTVAGATTAQDPGGITWTDTVTNMIAGDYRERLITVTPASAAVSPLIGFATKGTVTADPSTAFNSASLNGDAINVLDAANDWATPGAGMSGPGQGGLYIELYTCTGTWTSANGAVTSATDDRDYTCSTGGDGNLLANYDIPASGYSPTQWVIPQLSAATNVLIRTRLIDDTTTNGRQQTLYGETITLTHRLQASTPDNWAQISSGRYNTCGIKTDGTLWCWGSNGSGQLGQGDASDRSTATQVGVATNWANVSTGGAHVCATKTDGTLWCWGANTNGQVGVGDNTNRTTPTQVGTDTTWTQVSGANASSHSCGIKSNGTLWCWGLNTYGRLGVGDTTDRNAPVQVGAATNWSSVRLGAGHSCATKTDNTMWCWGLNISGQLGVGDTTDRYTPTQVGAATTWRTPSPGNSFTCATKTDGTLWCWGTNASYRTGLNIQSGTTLAPTQLGVATTWGISQCWQCSWLRDT